MKSKRENVLSVEPAEKAASSDDFAPALMLEYRRDSITCLYEQTSHNYLGWKTITYFMLPSLLECASTFSSIPVPYLMLTLRR